MKKKNKNHKKKLSWIGKNSGRRIEKLETGSKREDKQGKGLFNLLPPRALQQVALRLEYGSKKYGPNNWNNGIQQSKLLDSALRHLIQFMKGDTDENHLVASACNILQMIEQSEKIKEGKLNKHINDL